MFYLLTVLLLWRRQPHERYAERETEREGKKLSRGKCGKLLCLEMENFTTVQRMRCAYQLSHLASKRKRALERQGEERKREGRWAAVVALACKRKNLESLQIYLFIYLFSFSSLQAIHFSIYHARDWGKSGGKIKVIVAVRRKLEELQERGRQRERLGKWTEEKEVEERLR